jgi:hyperosmotically inducible periplasmic protein
MSAMIRRLSLWACAAGVLVFSVACENTAIGFKRDTEDNSKKAAIKASEAAGRASQATAEATRAAADAAQAAAETVNVKTALIADKRVVAKDIDVDTDRTTRTVILKGRVPNEEQKAIAEQIAVERSAGYHVRNELTIGN